MDFTFNPFSLSALADAADLFAEPLINTFFAEPSTRHNRITTTTAAAATTTTTTTTTSQLYTTVTPSPTMSPPPFKPRTHPNLPPEFDFSSDSLQFRTDKSIDWTKLPFEFPKAGDGTKFDGRLLSEHCTPVTYARAFYADKVFEADQPSPEVVANIYKEARFGNSKMDPRDKKYNCMLFPSAEAKARAQMENDFGWELSLASSNAKNTGLGLQQQAKEYSTYIKWMCKFCKKHKKVGMCALGYCKFTKTTNTAGEATITHTAHQASQENPTIHAEITILMLFPHDKNCHSKPHQDPAHHPRNLYTDSNVNHYMLHNLDHNMVFGDLFKESVQNLTVGEEVFKQYPKLDGAEKINTGGWDDREFCALPYYGKSKSIVASVTEEKFIPAYIRLSFWVMQQMGIANDACPFKVDHGPSVPVCGYEGYLDDDDTGRKSAKDLEDEAVAFAERHLKSKSSASPNSSVSSGNEKKRGRGDCVTRYINQLRWYPNPRFHLYFAQNTIIFGGMDMKGHTDAAKVIHQVLHNDSTHLMDKRDDPEHPLYQGKPNKLVENASFIAPLVQDQPRKIYHINPTKQFEIEYSKALLFSGAWPHGGWTYLQSESFQSVTLPDGTVASRRLFRPAFHGHLDSIHLQRDEDYLNIGYYIPGGYRPSEHSVTGPTAEFTTAESAFREQETALHSTVNAIVQAQNYEKLKQFPKFDQAKIIMQTQLTIPQEECKVPEFARGSLVVPNLPDEDPSVLESSLYLTYRGLSAVAGSTALLSKQEQTVVKKVMQEIAPYLPESVRETMKSKKRRKETAAKDKNAKKAHKDGAGGVQQEGE